MTQFISVLNETETARIEGIIGYVFRDKKLLSKAFTHSSYLNEHKGAVSNERLEFLGDRILNFIEAKNLFYNVSGGEGKLTEQLIKRVSREPLAESVRALGLLEFLKTSDGANPGEFEAKAVSNLYEAIVAAIYVDCGLLDVCAEFIARTLTAVEVADCISALKEYGEKNKIEQEKSFAEAGDGFTCVIRMQGAQFSGRGRKKKDAEYAAAKAACKHFNIS